MNPSEVGKKIEDESMIEGQKLAYDAFKHLTTLNTGSILLLAGFLKDLFPNPVYTGSIPIIFVSFIISVIGSLLMMFIFCYTVQDKGEVKNKVSTVLIISGFVLSFIPFILAIILFVVFILANYYK